MGHCKDCKWWGGPGEFSPCWLAQTSNGGKDKLYPDTKAWALGGAGAAGIIVTPDFGCVQFEVKTDAAN